VAGEYPPVDVYENEDEVLVRAEVPGVAKDELGLSLLEGKLVIRGKKPAEAADQYVCRVRECWSGEFSRAVALPEGIDPDAEPSASLRNGVLTVRLARLPAPAGRKIEVRDS